jgi:hypothetical protein
LVARIGQRQIIYHSGGSECIAADAIYGNPAEPYRILSSTIEIDPVKVEEKISIYPNPVETELRITNYGMAKR